MHGFLEKIGDLSWVGPTYADKGWVELTDVEQTQIKMKGVTSRKNQEEAFVAQKLKDLSLTVEQKAKWVEYLLSLDLVSLQADAAHNPRFPSRPNA